MIIDGRQIAEEVYAQLEEVRRGLSAAPRLGIVVGTNDPVTSSFVRIKSRAAERLGVEIVRAELSEVATTAETVAAVSDIAERVDGIIVQLPLPSSIDTDVVLAAIAPEQDVDGISLHPRVRPPVAGAVAEIVRREHISMQGKRAVVVGSGRLVGAPCAALLTELGAEVTVINKGDSLDALKASDIVVLGAGEPVLVKSDMIHDGVVLIDAGTSEQGGKVIGDADPVCASIASIFTPVPGGIGPIAVAMIFKNLFALMGYK